jgi:hypothetical protein
MVNRTGPKADISLVQVRETSFCLGETYAAGGPRSVWDEKPFLVNVTGTNRNSASATVSGGMRENDATAVVLGRVRSQQQPMGAPAIRPLISFPIPDARCAI